MTPLFEAIVKNCPPPDVDENGPLQLQVSLLDYSSYVGAIGIGRIKRGKIRRNSPVVVVDREGKVRNERIMQVMGFLGLDRVEVDEASAGDIVAFAGIEYPEISDTICDPGTPEALPPLVVDEPTISMTFEVNNSPFCGREGKYVTSRQIRERLLREAHDQRRAARRGDRRSRTSSASSAAASCTWACCWRTCAAKATSWRCRGRAWSSRRSTASCASRTKRSRSTWTRARRARSCRSSASAAAQLTGMHPDGKGRVRLDYIIPSRGLIGFQTEFRTHDLGHRDPASHLRSLRAGAGSRDRPAPRTAC